MTAATSIAKARAAKREREAASAAIENKRKRLLLSFADYYVRMDYAVHCPSVPRDSDSIVDTLEDLMHEAAPVFKELLEMAE